MFQYHPEIMQELGRERQAKDLDAAKRERMLASDRTAGTQTPVRWVLVALAGAAPIALLMIWLLIVR